MASCKTKKLLVRRKLHRLGTCTHAMALPLCSLSLFLRRTVNTIKFSLSVLLEKRSAEAVCSQAAAAKQRALWLVLEIINY
jgi:hypothetical protein